jgi:hypothetical protein
VGFRRYFPLLPATTTDREASKSRVSSVVPFSLIVKPWTSLTPV